MERIRGFEKVSSEINNDDVIIPRRATKHSVGYDFFSPIDITIPANGFVSIKTGIKIYFPEDEALFFYSRSSWANKYGICLRNSVAVFECDYYNNPKNEGEAIITLKNTTDSDFDVKKGDRFCQAVFQKYFVADNDIVVDQVRQGGVGSTGK